MKKNSFLLGIIFVINLMFLTGCTDSLSNIGGTNITLEEEETIKEPNQEIEEPNNSIQVPNIPQITTWDESGCMWVSIDDVLDGDTLVSGKSLIRLIGIDSPETDPASGLEEFYAFENKFFVSEAIGNDQVCLKEDSFVEAEDSFGRMQRYVYTRNGNFLNSSLVRWGYARVLESQDFNFKDLFYEKERQAKRENLGIWDIESKKAYNDEIGFEVKAYEKDRIKEIDANIAKDFVGKDVTINLTVNSTFDNGNEIFLNSEDLFNDPDNFTVVIRASDMVNFRLARINPLVQYRRKQIQVSGRIENYKDNIRVYVSTPEDIKVIED